MSEKIKLVQGDTRPALVCVVTDSATGAALNITGATPRLKFRALGATALTATLVGVVTDGTAGQCVFHPASAPEMLAGDAGDYEGEVEITFSDGQIQTLYDVLKFKVREDF
jgi:hypothetical protein